MDGSHLKNSPPTPICRVRQAKFVLCAVMRKIMNKSAALWFESVLGSYVPHHHIKQPCNPGS